MSDSMTQEQTNEAAVSASGVGDGLAFGLGRLVVDTGAYHGRAAVFVCPVDQPGEIGSSAKHLGHDRHSLQPGEQVWTFSTPEHAKTVADALVSPTPSPAIPDSELVEVLRGIKWRSVCRDNMEFAATITYVQMDAIRSLLAKLEGKS